MTTLCRGGFPLAIHSIRENLVSEMYIEEIGNFEEVEELVEAILECTSLKKLNLSSITDVSMEQIGKILTSTAITSLNLSNIPIGENEIPILLNSLYQNTTLKKLKLDDCNLSGKAIRQLSTWLSVNFSIRKLSLRYNPFHNPFYDSESDEPIRGQTSLVWAMKRNSTLLELKVAPVDCEYSPVHHSKISKTLIYSDLFPSSVLQKNYRRVTQTDDVRVTIILIGRNKRKEARYGLSSRYIYELIASKLTYLG